MWSKNKAKPTRDEAQHMAAVKELPCSVCDAPGPSDAHHINQGQHFTTVALCRECHIGNNGWHGKKVMWRIRKMDELDALSITIQRLFYGSEGYVRR